MFNSRVLRVPLEKAEKRMKAALEEGAEEEDCAYVLYSSHDTQVSQMLEFLKPVDFNYYSVPFTSQIYFEFYYTPSCPY